MRAKQNRTPVNMPASVANVYKESWNLTSEQSEALIQYCLRSWSSSELAEQLLFNSSGNVSVKLWGESYEPIFTGNKETWDQIKYLAVRGREYADPVNNKQPMFWLSFRCGYADGIKFTYVIVQEDNKKGVSSHGNK